ncbi:MAG: hypothetical protein WC787_04460 [Patescibacteria group bacterium]|jgi:hypothetical protein
MVAYDEEYDGYVNSDSYEDCLEGREIRVRFSVEGEKIFGRVLPQNKRTRPVATKIVFSGRNWRGPLPTHGQELMVRVVRDTKPHDPARGALIVERRQIDGSCGGQCAKCPDCGKHNVRQLSERPGAFLSETTCPDCKGVFEIFWPR